MSLRPAFTIIELVIALSVAVLIGSIAIPGYSSFLRQQDLASGAQLMASCMQRAQSEAAAPSQAVSKEVGGILGFTGVIYSNPDQSGNLSCKVYGYKKTEAEVSIDIDFPPLPSDGFLLYSASAPNVSIRGCSYTKPGAAYKSCDTAGGLPEVSAYFGVVESGQPIAFLPCKDSCDYRFDVSSSNDDRLVANQDRPRGFPFTITMADTSGDSFSRTLSVPQIGVPIQIQ